MSLYDAWNAINTMVLLWAGLITVPTILSVPPRLFLALSVPPCRPSSLVGSPFPHTNACEEVRICESSILAKTGTIQNTSLEGDKAVGSMVSACPRSLLSEDDPCPSDWGVGVNPCARQVAVGDYGMKSEVV